MNITISDPQRAPRTTGAASIFRVKCKSPSPLLYHTLIRVIFIFASIFSLCISSIHTYIHK